MSVYMEIPCDNYCAKYLFVLAKRTRTHTHIKLFKFIIILPIFISYTGGHMK